MNIRTLTILIGLSCSGNIFAQVQAEVNKVLATKDFVAFKKFASNLSNQNKGISAHWDCLRDLTTDFKEGVFIFEKTVPDEDNPAISSIYTFRVTLITTESQIAYYELSEKKNKKVEGDWVPYYETIDKFKSDSAYLVFRKSFQEIFQTDLNDRELFITDFVYGKFCGYSPRSPEGRQHIDKFVENGDKGSLLKWLQSANTEKQVYGLDGLYQLSKSGVKLTEQELKMIKFVAGKKGTMYVCSGCLRLKQEIGSVTNGFKF